MTIELRVFKAKSGVSWFKSGWQIFKTQPSTFIFMYLFIIIVGLLPISLSFLHIPAALAMPFLMAGFYAAVLKKQQGQPIMLSDIVKPFSNTEVRLSLLRLGLYQMAMGLLFAMAIGWLFQDAFLLIEQNIKDPEKASELFLAALKPESIILFVCLLGVYLMAFAYAVPMVYFQKQCRIFEVIKVSLLAFWHNIAPLSLFGGIVALLFFISFPLSLIPLLVVIPVSYIGFFVSFQAIFADFNEEKQDQTDNESNSDGQFSA